MRAQLQLRRWCTAGALAGLLTLVLTPLLHAKTANTPQPPFQVGRLWQQAEYDGAEGWGEGAFFQYPAGIPKQGVLATDPSWLKRSWIGQCQKGGNYLMVTDWTDPVGTPYSFAGSYFFRSMDYTYPRTYVANGKFDYNYPVGVQEWYRWQRPNIVVNDTSLYTLFFPPFRTDTTTVNYPNNDGAGPRPAPRVDPDLVSECAIEMHWRFIPGVELRRMMYGYPYGSAHQDYILHDITLTNNGKSYGDTVSGPTLTNQTISKMLWAQAFDYRHEQAVLAQYGKDCDGRYIEPWGVGNHSAVWLTDLDDQTAGGNPGPDWGDPSEDVYYNGLLMAADAIIGPVFTSVGAGANYAVDDPAQPACRMIWHERGLDYAGKTYSPVSPEDQRNMLAGSFQLGINESYRDNAFTATIADEDQGPTAILGYGPLNGGTVGVDAPTTFGWDLGWQESVRIVQAFAGGAIDQEEGRRIGAYWNAQKTAQAPAATWMTQADQDLVKTAQDTALKAAALAYWNFNGQFAANVTSADLTKWGISGYVMSKPTTQNQPFNVPDAPRPPGYISTSSPSFGGEVQIRWTREAEQETDHDTGVMDMAGYKVYRQVGTRMAPWELIKSGLTSTFYALPGGDTLFYADKDVSAGTDYWYSVTAYDDGSQNWAQPGVKLESSRWWTWTGFSIIGTTARTPTAVSADKRPGAFSLAQNAPNPFNPSTTIRFTVPQTGDVKLVIYDVNGRTVRTLVEAQTPAGVHEVVWDGTDMVGRSVASGVYVYRLTGINGEITKRMTLVR